MRAFSSFFLCVTVERQEEPDPVEAGQINEFR
jgi:hypothetical protein